jgi:hypothetical protein
MTGHSGEWECESEGASERVSGVRDQSMSPYHRFMDSRSEKGYWLGMTVPNVHRALSCCIPQCILPWGPLASTFCFNTAAAPAAWSEVSAQTANEFLSAGLSHIHAPLVSMQLLLPLLLPTHTHTGPLLGRRCATRRLGGAWTIARVSGERV